MRMHAGPSLRQAVAPSEMPGRIASGCTDADVRAPFVPIVGAAFAVQEIPAEACP